ncbi:MAG: site-specific integrase [Acidobacteria bacterium]|nr:site-specific integrase [Acidobacteriota bacterium]
MIKRIFTRATIVARLEAGPVGPHLDSLATALREQRYSTHTIQQYLRAADAFGRWLSQAGLYLADVNESVIERYLTSLSHEPHALSRKQRQKVTSGIRALLAYLLQQGLVTACAATTPSTEPQEWVTRYACHLEQVLGLAPTTRQKYLFFAFRFLTAYCGTSIPDWSALTAAKITEFVQREAAPRKGFGPHGPVTAVRSFLRFLVMQGVIPAGLEAAVPPIRQWSQAALPQHLTPSEIERMLAACNGTTSIGLRDHAILLLLSRLGMRAKEVARLRLDDIDWVEGRLLVRASKTHCQRTLPLAKDIGQALLTYLRQGRPTSHHRDIFLRHAAPYKPLQTASAITKIVKRTMIRAKVEARSSGAHLFRHTAASQMVCRGASFKEVADVLGHQSLRTTAIYAKLDLAALSRVALPWPGGVQ